MINKKKISFQFLEILFLGLILMFGFYIRILPQNVVITPSEINLFAQDPYYHLRRVIVGLHNNNTIPTYDSYSGYPEGLYCFWSNIYEYSILWTSNLIGKGNPSVRQVELVTAYSPVIWGLLSLIPIYLVIRKIFDSKIALGSLFLICLLPAHVYQTLLGRADHYGADAFFPFLATFLMLKGLDNTNKIYFPILSGLCLTGAWLTWPGSTIFILINYIFLIGIVCYKYFAETHDNFHFNNLFITLISNLISIFPFAAGSWWGLKGLVVYDAISWFHIYTLIFILCIALIWRSIYSIHSIKQKAISAFSLSLGFGLLILLIFQNFSMNFLKGIGWVTKSDPWLKTITEFQPLFISMGVFSSFRALTFYGYIIFILPIILGLMMYVWHKNKEWNYDKIWFALYSTLIVFLGYNQIRFSHFMVIIVAICSIWILTSYQYIRKRNYFIYIAYGLLWICFAYSLRPAIGELKSIKDKYATVPTPWKNTLKWFRENTAPTSNLYNTAQKPEYGILAPWIAGHWINYLGQRPALANGFHVNGINNREGMRFYLAEDWNTAVSILETKKIKYFCLTDNSFNLDEYDQILGNLSKPPAILKKHISKPGGGYLVSVEPTERFYNLVSNQLYLRDNTPYLSTQNIPALCFETKQSWDVFGETVPCVKVYELIPGVIVKGFSKPNSWVNVTAIIQTNTGREFTFLQESFCDSKGEYQFLLPYPNKTMDLSIGAISPYSIKSINDTKQIEVTSTMIHKGSIINI